MWSTFRNDSIFWFISHKHIIVIFDFAYIVLFFLFLSAIFDSSTWQWRVSFHRGDHEWLARVANFHHTSWQILSATVNTAQKECDRNGTVIRCGGGSWVDEKIIERGGGVQYDQFRDDTIKQIILSFNVTIRTKNTKHFWKF